MSIHILVKQIAKQLRPSSNTSLQTEHAQPHKVTKTNLNPINIQQIASNALQHIEPMFHNMGFSKEDQPTKLKGDNINMHVMAQVYKIDKTRRTPFINIRHPINQHVLIHHNEGRWRIHTQRKFIAFAHPIKLQLRITRVCQTPSTARKNINIATHPQIIAYTINSQPHLA